MWSGSGFGWVGAYHGLPLAQRQLCWAHLKRDFAVWEAYEGTAARLSRWAEAECGRLFRLRHPRQRGEITPEPFARGCAAPGTFHAPALPRQKKVGRMADRLLGAWEALWTFTAHDEVEPTNNEAERSLRAGVIWRQTRFGSQSGRGLRMIERLLPVAETSRTQDRDLLEYLTAALTAHRLGRAPITTP